MYVFRGIKIIIYKTTLINTLIIIRKTLFIDRVFISFIITYIIYLLCKYLFILFILDYFSILN